MDFAAQIMTAPLGKTHIFFVGQAGFILKSKKGTLLAVDLYLSDCVERVDGPKAFKRLLPKALSPQDIVFDYIVATHPHYDHFDVDAMPLLMANHHTKLIASVDCAREVKRLLMFEENITYAAEGDSYDADDIHLDMVFCDHGAGAPDAFGLVITIDGYKIFMAGDTCLRLDQMEGIRAKGPFDMMIGPINGEFGNLNEREFAIMCHELSPKLAVPCHYGMCPGHGGSPKKYIEAEEEIDPQQKYLLMAFCEKYTFS